MRLLPPVLIGLAVAISSCVDADTQTALREWKVGAVPTQTIGGDGSTEKELSRVTGAWRLSNGATAIADAGATAIRIFDAGGAQAHSFGRKGEGPGEFRGMGWAGHFGDTAVVYDGGLRRITTILLDGAPRLLATLQLVPDDERAADGIGVGGRLTDGRWLVSAMGRPDVNARGPQRMPGFAGLIGSGGAGRVEWVAEAPDLAVLVYGLAGNRKMVNIIISAFPPSLAVAASGSSVWFGDTAADTIVRVDAATGAKQKIALPDPPAPVTRELIDAARARDLAEARDSAERDETEVKYRAAHVPTHLPAFEELMAGAGGELWVRTTAAGNAAEGRYLVLSTSGSPIARVSVAAGFRVTDVGRDYVVGVHRDDDGVESVRVYALTR